MMSTLSLPLIDAPQAVIETPEGILPLDGGKTCGNGCSSTKKHNGQSEASKIESASPTV